MTNRERINATLRCKPTDRPPVIHWLGLIPWAGTLERWRSESGIDDLDVVEYFGFDAGFLHVPVDLGPWPRFEHEVIEDGPYVQTYRDWRGIIMRNRKDGNTLPDYVANPVSSPADWVQYKEERMPLDITGRTREVAAFAVRAAEVDAPIQIGGFPFGLFGTPRDILGVEHLLLTYYDDPDLVRDIINTHVDLWLNVYKAAASAVPVDHIHIWEDMSGKQGSLISMDMVAEFMMPGYDRIAAFARDRGAVLSVDTDGLVDELVEIMYRHGVRSFFPFEAQAGNDVVAYRRRYPDMSVWGGLDKRALASGTWAMNRELARAEELFALGGYIVGFDHAIPPDVPWANFRSFVTDLKRVAGM